MHIKDIVIKDIKKILYDRKTLAILMLMPIVLTTILSFALKGTFDTDGGFKEPIKLALVKNYDNSFEKEKFKSMIMNDIENYGQVEINKYLEEMDPDKIISDVFDNKEIKKILTYVEMTESKALKTLEQNEVQAVVIFPKNFIYNTYMNYSPAMIKNKIEIKTIKTADNTFAGSIVQNIADSFTEQMSRAVVNKEVYNSVLSKYQIESKDINKSIEDIMQIGIDEEDLKIEEKSVSGKKPMDSFSYYAMAIMTMFIYFSAGFGGRALLVEKNEYTYQRLNVIGIPVWKMYIGTFFTSFSIAMLQSIILMVYSTLVLGVNWGNILYVIITALLLATTIGSMGLLISCITIKANNFKFVNFFENGLVFFMALVGGSYIPISQLPKFLQNLSDFSVNGLGIKMYSKIMLGESFSSISTHAVYLVAMSFVFISIALLYSRTGKEIV